MAYYDKPERRNNWERIGSDTLLALGIVTPIAILVFLILHI